MNDQQKNRINLWVTVIVTLHIIIGLAFILHSKTCNKPEKKVEKCLNKK
jgi:heme/copper-type cytochrome/quinol oxidase subunit 4